MGLMHIHHQYNLREQHQLGRQTVSLKWLTQQMRQLMQEYPGQLLGLVKQQ